MVFNILIIICMFFLFKYHQLCITGAKSGLLLWFNTIIPSIFPFILLTNLIKEKNGLSIFEKILNKPIHILFHCTRSSTYIILSGFLFGYPLGAKTITDALNSKKINIDEANYLMTFCNQPSPMFMLGFIQANILNPLSQISTLMIGIYLSAFFNAQVFYLLKYKKTLTQSLDHSTNKYVDFQRKSSISPDFIIQSLILIQKIGALIIIFSIFGTLLSYFLRFLPTLSIGLITGLFEQTCGLNIISTLNINNIIPVFFIICFGGLSVIGQIYSIIKSTKLSLTSFLIAKICQCSIGCIILLMLIS